MFLLLTVLCNTLSDQGPGKRGTGADCPAHSQQPIRRHDRWVRKPEEHVIWVGIACSGSRSRDTQGCGDLEGEGLSREFHERRGSELSPQERRGGSAPA